jgi:hypothetical protein
MDQSNGYLHSVGLFLEFLRGLILTCKLVNLTNLIEIINSFLELHKLGKAFRR